MSSSNAPIVFGPTLLRPEKETMESTLNSPLVNQAIQRFIDVSSKEIVYLCYTFLTKYYFIASWRTLWLLNICNL